MDELRQWCPFSFRQLEAVLVRNFRQTYARALEGILESIDAEIDLHRDRRYQVKDRRPRTLETLLGVPVRFTRRLYWDQQERQHVYLLDELLGLSAHQQVSPGLREPAVLLAVTGPSYRGAAEEWALALGGPGLSHQTLQQLAIAAGRQAAAAQELKRAQGSGEREVPFLFLEVDGLYEHLQQDPRRGVEERVLTAHEGWHRQGKRWELVHKRVFRSQTQGIDEFWEAASEQLRSAYDLAHTWVIINGDRASWIQAGQEYFEHAVYQVDRFHLAKEIRDLLGRANTATLREIFKAISSDATGQGFLDALRKHREELPVDKQQELDALIADLEPIAPSVCDYRVRLQALGVNTEALRGLGAAESQMSAYADRTKSRGRSWSRTGVGAMMQLMAAKMEGGLIEVLALGQEALDQLEQWKNQLQEAAKQAVEVSRTALSQPVHPGHVRILDAGRGRSGGLSYVIRRVVDSPSY